MNKIAIAILLCVFTTALAGSIVLNIVLLKSTEDPGLVQSRVSVVEKISDLRRVGVLLENNLTDRFIVMSYADESGENHTLRLSLTQNTSIVRIATEKSGEAIVEKLSAVYLEQADLTVGETLYAGFNNSTKNNRLEVVAIWVGNPLPLPQ